MVPFGTVISYVPVDKATLISHFNIFRTAEINMVIAAGCIQCDALAALQPIAIKPFPQGYTYEFWV